MPTVQKSIDVAVPVSTAYNQWTQFEQFPRFMTGVERIDQITDTRTRWKTNIGGVTREFEAEITEQHPDERVAWRTVDGVHQSGVVTFHRLDEDSTRVTLQMEYQPQGVVERAGELLRVGERSAASDLKRFKTFIEKRAEETGAWRGDVPRKPQRGEAPGPGRDAEPAPLSPRDTGDPRPVDPVLGRPEEPPG
jgi:uncharacterized membrane protein